MGNCDGEVLIPVGVLGIGDDTGAGDCGTREADGDIGVTSDDLPVVVLLPVPVSTTGVVDCSTAGDETTPETL